MRHNELDIAAMISRDPIFEDCIIEEVRDLLRCTRNRIRHKEPEVYLAHMGDKCSDIIMLVSGKIYTSMTNHDGKEIVVGTLEGPVTLAPALAFSNNFLFPVNQVTKTACTLLYIDRHDFVSYIQRNKDMMAGLIRVLSERCTLMSRKVKEISLLSLKERVLEYLKRHRKIDNVAWLARIMGVARPSLSRVLSELHAEGVIVRTFGGQELAQ